MNSIQLIGRIGLLSLLALLMFAMQVSASTTLTVETQGDGYVSSYPSGILCGAACVESYNTGTVMTLTATPTNGATFTGWSGCDEENGNVCTVVLSSDQKVIATFTGEVKSEYTLRVYRTGSPGVVQTSNREIYCGSICTYDEAKFPAGSSVTLSASANQGYAFAGWSGDCSGSSSTCTVTIDSAKTVTATFGTGASDGAAGSATPSITVKKSGEGSGTITSSDKKINCGTACTSTYNSGSSVTLTATVSPGSSFDGWEGACTGIKPTCAATIDSAKAVTAKFSKTIYTHGLKVSTSGSGTDKVVSADSKVDCTVCTVKYPQGTSVTLTAIPAPEWEFDSWIGSGCDSVKMPVCIVKIDGSMSLQASFKAIPKYNVIIEKSGEGSGAVKSKDGSIDCGGYCSKIFLRDSVVPLEAIPNKGSLFSRWENQCDVGGGESVACTLNINSDKKAIANFAKKQWTLFIDPLTAGKIVSTDAAKTVDCASGCSAKIYDGTSITLKVMPDKDWHMLGWTGDCSGKDLVCTFIISDDMMVGASLEFRQRYQKLTVVNKFNDVVAAYETRSGAGSIEKIKCGEQASKYNTATLCSADFKADDYVEIVPSKNLPGMQWNGCDSRIINVCLVRMTKDRVVEITMSPPAEMNLVRKALWNLYGNANPALDSYINNDNNPPFKKTLQDLKFGKMGHTVSEIEEWIANNRNWYLNEGGMQKVIDDWQKGVAKQVLLEVFAPEIAKYPALVGFLADESQKPFQTAWTDFKAGRGDGDPAGLKAWIGNPDAKQWYYDATGIREFINAQIEAINVANRPSITSISPDNRQLGGKPKIRGNFHDVKLVTLNDMPVSSDVISENEIIINNIRWGQDSWGVEVNVPGIVTVHTSYGSATSKLINPSDSIYLNAVGKEEGCFPGVGNGCDGGGPQAQAVLRGMLGKEIGCDDPEADGGRSCSMSAGSIEHDNCCVRFPSGKWCGGPGVDGKGTAGETNHDGHCAIEWEHAFWDTFWGRAWREIYYPGDKFDLTPSGTSPKGRYVIGEAVSSIEYCAPKSHEMREMSHAVFCCSGVLGRNKKCT